MACRTLLGPEAFPGPFPGGPWGVDILEAVKLAEQVRRLREAVHLQHVEEL